MSEIFEVNINEKLSESALVARSSSALTNNLPQVSALLMSRYPWNRDWLGGMPFYQLSKQMSAKNLGGTISVGFRSNLSYSDLQLEMSIKVDSSRDRDS